MNYCHLFLIHTQISSNGLISFGTPFTSNFAATFPISQQVITPYWDDIDLSWKGSVRYATIRLSHSTLSPLLGRASRYISNAMDIRFVATMMLVARWVDACPFGNNRCSNVSKSTIIVNYCRWTTCITTIKENNFQAVVVTNGVQSYAVFTYKCGELNWVRNRAGIGFSASSTLFANHPLSRQSNVNSIACLNSPSSPWSNVVYRISGKA